MNTKAAVIDLLGQGLKDREIAERVGCCPQNVHYIRTQAGIPATVQRQPAPEQHHYLADARIGFTLEVRLVSRTAAGWTISTMTSSIKTLIAKADKARRIFSTPEAAEAWLAKH